MAAESEELCWILHLDGEPIAGMANPRNTDMFWVSYEVIPFAGFENATRSPIGEIEGRITFSMPGEDTQGPGIIALSQCQQSLGKDRLDVRGPYIERPPPARPWFWQQLIDWFKRRRHQGELSLVPDERKP